MIGGGEAPFFCCGFRRWGRRRWLVCIFFLSTVDWFIGCLFWFISPGRFLFCFGWLVDF